MPENMQRRQKVARLDMDDHEAEIVEDALEDVEERDIPDPLSDEEYYQIALKSLQRGMTEKDAANKLVSEGMSRKEAKKLVQQVKAENPDIARTNAFILLGAGALLASPGVLLLIWNLLGASSVYLTPSLLLILVGCWFLYKGIVAYRNLH